MIKKLLGLNPNLTKEGSYSPSNLALKLATSQTTDYREVTFANSYKGKALRIIVLCTEQANLTMANGKKFSTGNHPVETFVPMLHLKNAGFEFDIFTPTGKPAQLEMWAMPAKDKQVMAIYEAYKAQLERPHSIEDFAKNSCHNNHQYVAIFIPGGHGALLGLPTDKNVGDVIRWAFKKDLFCLAICHGPAALLSAKTANETFIYSGYKIAAFPDSVDRQTPFIGYMPGQLTWFFGEQLKESGISIVNSKADKTCFADRKLITGASPKAANEFGKLAATHLLKSIHKEA